jgi:hypothetical protein
MIEPVRGLMSRQFAAALLAHEQRDLFAVRRPADVASHHRSGGE